MNPVHPLDSNYTNYLCHWCILSNAGDMMIQTGCVFLGPLGFHCKISVHRILYRNCYCIILLVFWCGVTLAMLFLWAYGMLHC